MRLARNLATLLLAASAQVAIGMGAGGMAHAQGNEFRSKCENADRKERPMMVASNCSVVLSMEASKLSKAQRLKYLTLRAEAYLASRQKKKAAADFAAVIELNPSSAAAYLGLGKAQEYEDSERAIEFFTKALTLNPKLADAYTLRAERRNAKDHDGRIEDFSAAIANGIVTPEIYSARSDAYSAKMQYDKALKDNDALLAINPIDDTAYHSRSDLLKAMGDMDGAIAAMTKAISLKDDADYRGARADLLMAKKDWKGALADLDTLIRKSPKDDFARYRRARVHQEMGALDLQLADLMALRLDGPEWASLRVERAGVLMNSKRHPEAIEELSGVLADRDRVDRSTLIQALVSRAEAHEITGRIADAIRDYTELVPLHSRPQIILEFRGRAHLMNNAVPEAVADFSEALKIDPKALSPLFWRGLAFTIASDLPKAADDARALASARPPSLLVAITRFVLSSRGDLSAAKAELQAFKSGQPEGDPSHRIVDVFLGGEDIASARAAIAAHAERCLLGFWWGKLHQFSDHSDLAKTAFNDAKAACAESVVTERIFARVFSGG
jgi:tetratricopeptide (TPR) repeat protein